MTRPSHLRIVASGDDWATELRRRQIQSQGDHVWEQLRERVAKQDRQTRTIRCTIGFLAANWFAASLVTCICLYFAAEVLGR